MYAAAENKCRTTTRLRARGTISRRHARLGGHLSVQSTCPSVRTPCTSRAHPRPVFNTPTMDNAWSWDVAGTTCSFRHKDRHPEIGADRSIRPRATRRAALSHGFTQAQRKRLTTRSGRPHISSGSIDPPPALGFSAHLPTHDQTGQADRVDAIAASIRRPDSYSALGQLALCTALRHKRTRPLSARGHGLL